ncbi:MAG: branched-chain amino acid aminotransferase [Bacteroidales bacterium]|jgi:branched-chain amino acid aminotransferase|nr:branched-chain amino acid aminotransferase [Bacteroidales bacterium]
MNTNTDWATLPFAYTNTGANVRCSFSNNQWGEITVHSDDILPIHMAATCLHYGQECFEGLKAYRGKDGNIRLFRWKDNAARFNRSARRVGMQEIPEEVFEKALFTLIENNRDSVPPYGTGATLYIRPLLIGTTPRLGLNRSEDYLFVMFACPVGPYFKNGFKPGKVVVERDSDRAAPLGTGTVKIGGNYAAALNTTLRVQKEGYSSAMYLDPKQKTYIDECGPANFFGIKGNSYVTPQSSSILESITNLSLMTLAEHIGLTVERRQIPLEELAEFSEAAQCGTAAVLSPIYSITDPATSTVYTFGKPDEVSPVCSKLYTMLTGIQSGDLEDIFGWITLL